MLKRILIIISYVGISVGIIVATIILVAYGQGYSYSFKTRQFSLNGLLSIQSQPSGADVYLNGKIIHRQTPYRTTLPTGSYHLELRKTGYRAWDKDVVVSPFQVSLLTTILMIPDTITTTGITPNQTVSNLAATADRKHFAYFTPDPAAGVWVLNPDRKNGTKIYSPEVATADHPAETISDISWSNDGSHILVHGTIGDSPVYTVVAADGSNPLNLTDLFKFDLSGIRFGPGAWNELFWNSPDGLRRIDVNNRTVSAVLASQVSAYTYAGDRIVYIQTTPLGKSVWSMDHNGNGQKRLLESLAESMGYEIAYSHYGGRDVLAVLPHVSGTVTLYFDIFSSAPVSKVISQYDNQLIFSDDGHYLAYWSANGYGTYDLDKNIELARQKHAGITNITWFDPEHLVLSSQGQAQLAELDGANQVNVAPIIAGTTAYASADGRHIYTVGPGKGAMATIFGTDIKK